MKKVKVTQEQSDWLDKYVTGDEIDYALDYKIYRKLPDSPITDWKTSKLARALYAGYEVEPKFKVGDWVICEDGYIGEIEFINELEGWSNIGWSKESKEKGVCLAATYDLIDIVRHATPEEIAKEKERRWWKEHGREPWQLIVNDSLISRSSDNVRIVRSVYADCINFGDGLGLRPIEDVRKEFKVFCFADDRQDV